MLSEIASHKKTNTVLLYLYEAPGVVIVIETESRKVAARGWGKGGLGNCLMGVEFQFCGMKRVLEIAQQRACT